jgi:hypothetical protein
MPRYTNITLKVDQQILLWARMRALKDGISLSRKVTDFLEEYAAIPESWWTEVGVPARPRRELGRPMGPHIPPSPAPADAPPGQCQRHSCGRAARGHEEG